VNTRGSRTVPFRAHSGALRGGPFGDTQDCEFNPSGTRATQDSAVGGTALGGWILGILETWTGSGHPQGASGRFGTPKISISGFPRTFEPPKNLAGRGSADVPDGCSGTDVPGRVFPGRVFPRRWRPRIEAPGDEPWVSRTLYEPWVSRTFFRTLFPRSRSRATNPWVSRTLSRTDLKRQSVGPQAVGWTCRATGSTVAPLQRFSMKTARESRKSEV
jgi:hypothetical protein